LYEMGVNSKTEIVYYKTRWTYIYNNDTLEIIEEFKESEAE
jgi:hypothetical protein